MFRLRYVHCLSTGAVKHLLSTSSRVALSANIAAEIFGSSCRTHCVLLYSDPAEHQHHENVENQTQRLKECKTDFQTLQMTRSVLNYVPSRPLRFSPEALLSYLGVKLQNRKRRDNSISISMASHDDYDDGHRSNSHNNNNNVTAGGKSEAKSENSQQTETLQRLHLLHHLHQQQHVHHQRQLSATATPSKESPRRPQQHLHQYSVSDDSVSLLSTGLLHDNNHNNNNVMMNNNNNDDDNNHLLDLSRLLRGQRRGEDETSESTVAMKMRSEIVALNDLIVELRGRALRSEELLREERSRSALLQQENELLKMNAVMNNQQACSKLQQISIDQNSSMKPLAVEEQHGLRKQSETRPRAKTPTAHQQLSSTATTTQQNGDTQNQSGVDRRSTSNVRSSNCGAINKCSSSPSTPRAMSSRLDDATRRASPSSNTFRREAPWIARRAVEAGRITANVQERRKMIHGEANDTAFSTSSLSSPQRHQQEANQMRVVTSLHRPKLVTATRAVLPDASGFAPTRMVRHNQWQDPQQIML